MSVKNRSWKARGSGVALALLCLGAPTLAAAQDADGDGVPDTADGAPCDASADGVAFAPAEGQSMMMAWEDLWPSVGDADFNDLVFSVNYAFRTQGSLVRSVKLTLGVLAVGSDYDNGVGLHLPVSRGLVASVTRTSGGVTTDLVLEPDGELTTIISNNAREFFNDQAGPINSVGAAQTPVSVEVEIFFTQPVVLDIGAAPFDVFLVRSNDRTHEIHPTGYAGTQQMNTGLFGTGDDGSTSNRWFVDNRGVPFVLILPELADWPAELEDIVQLYPGILAFAASGGATNRDYYKSTVNSAFAYPDVPRAPTVGPAVDGSCLVGQTPEAAGRTCQEIYTDLNGNVADGRFWIDPDGVGYGESAIQVWCDMANGGWAVLHYDDYAFARSARGVPSAAPGWSVDYYSASSPIQNARVESFRFEVEGGPAKTFDDVKRYGAVSRPTIFELFGGAHPRQWQCNTDAPNSNCHITTGDGRHWGVWENRSGCCIGPSTGGFWYYSQSTSGTENYGICGDGYPNGASYSGSQSGCSGTSHFTPINPTGVQRFKLSVRFYVPPRPEGQSCRTILAEGNSRGDGVYVIDPDGPFGNEPMEVWCDMTTDGGGWIVLHDDLYANARSPRGTPSASTGWSVDYLSAGSVLRDLPVEDFIFDLPGIQSKTFRNVTGYNSQRRLTPPDLFSGGHSQTWTCDTDNPASSACYFSTDGNSRHWGLWESTSSCCIGSATGGFWFYSRSTSGTENWGLCGDGFPNGTGFPSGATGCTGGYYTPVNPTGSQRYVLKIREPAQAVPLNMKSLSRSSCRAILDGGESQGDGVYWIDGPTGPMRAYCDMTTDGGGWTAFHSSTNGSPNVFDHFDANTYRGLCYDPDKACLRNMPADLDIANTEVAVSIGGSAVAFDLTPTLEAYFKQGTQASWQTVAGRNVGAGPVRAGVNSFWTGSGANTGWIAATNQNSSLVFASQYDYSAGWNMGNGVANDTSSRVRLMYREGGRPADPILNAQANARLSCRDILDRGEANGSGVYWLRTSGGATYTAYCDMVTDGGGWTAFVSGYNGSFNTFDHMEAGYHTGVCTDPVRRCMRRIPASTPSAGAEMAVVVDDTVVAIPFNTGMWNWATAGTQSGWQTGLSSVVLAGSPGVTANSMWTGSGANTSWIVSQNSTQGTTLAAQYDYNTGWNYARGALNTWSLVRLMYREGGIPVDPTAFNSCEAARAAGNTADGVYRIQRNGGRSRDAYCEMSSDGGGWQAIYVGRVGQQHVFDHYDAAYHSGVCTDVGTQCLRTLPGDVDLAQLEMAVSCGTTMVAFTPPAAVRNYFTSGTQANWQSIGTARSIGASTPVHMPTELWTGSGTNRGFIFARGRTQSQTLASSYVTNSSWDYCNAVVDRSSTLRVYFRDGQ